MTDQHEKVLRELLVRYEKAWLEPANFYEPDALALTALLDERERMKDWIMNFAVHGFALNDDKQFCRAEHTRLPERYPCTCGLDDLRRELKGD